VAAIPDDGLRLLISGDGVPGALASLRAAPSLGPHADSPTRRVPLVDIGPGTNAVLPNLTNKAALILRTTNALDTFARKINYAAQAGAAFAVIYNYSTNYNPDPKTQPGDQVFAIGATDFVPIPAVFIGNSDGEALRSLIETNSATLAQIYLQTTNYVFNVTNTMICEHVGLRVMSDHQSRGDVRITLVSPSGTRSVLQRYNFDPVPGPVDWTYYSTHHFFESTAGPWTAYFSDEMAGHTGSVRLASLILEGVPIHDRDQNGLDDYWEVSFFNSIFSQSAKDDPDQDGYSNAREQVMGTDPVVPDDPLQVDFSLWNQNYARLSWPSTTYLNYEVWGGTNLNSFSRLATVPGRFPESEWFTPYKNPACQFFRIRAVAP
jgi:subtilisin-like proprotein convertase family protein